MLKATEQHAIDLREQLDQATAPHTRAWWTHEGLWGAGGLAVGIALTITVLRAVGANQ